MKQAEYVNGMLYLGPSLTSPASTESLAYGSPMNADVLAQNTVYASGASYWLYQFIEDLQEGVITAGLLEQRLMFAARTEGLLRGVDESDNDELAISIERLKERLRADLKRLEATPEMFTEVEPAVYDALQLDCVLPALAYA